jgi:hypothetical protein
MFLNLIQKGYEESGGRILKLNPVNPNYKNLIRSSWIIKIDSAEPNI